MTFINDQLMPQVRQCMLLVILVFVPILPVMAAPQVTVINNCVYDIQDVVGGRYELGNDLICTGVNFGIRILNSKRVKLSLNGYAIDGSTNGQGGDGIIIYGSENIEISGPGLITGWDFNSTSRGLEIGQTGFANKKILVHDLIIDANNDGIIVSQQDTTQVKVFNNVIANSLRYGIAISNGASGNSFERNEILSNNYGISFGEGDSNEAIGNNVSLSANTNIYIWSGSTNTLVLDNIALFGVNYDIYDQPTSTAVIMDNTCLVGGNTDDCDALSDFNIDH